MRTSRFEKNLDEGLAGESMIAKWMRKRGNYVLPVYEKSEQDGKGPRLLGNETELVAPDIIVMNNRGMYWVEAKHKTAFSWHRKTKRWVTGIDIRHYNDYSQIDDFFPYPVWLLFLHKGGKAKDSPDISPSGLYGNSISFLRENENHRHKNWGSFGMVYWAEESLLKLAEHDDLIGV